MANKNLLEISEFTGEGYQPLIHFEKWRVAMLRYCDELLPQNIKKFQKHEKTDEVFVLLKGECSLFLADGKDQIGDITVEKLEPLKIYNVKKGTWHSHTLSRDASVLIVENDDTGDRNSPEITLTEEQRNFLCSISKSIC